MKMFKGILISFAVLVFSGEALAQHYHHRHPHHHRTPQHWVGPMLGGVILGAAISSAYAYQPPPVYVPPVVTAPSVPYQTYNCLVQVYDPITDTVRNEVRTCIR